MYKHIINTIYIRLGCELHIQPSCPSAWGLGCSHCWPTAYPAEKLLWAVHKYPYGKNQFIKFTSLHSFIADSYRYSFPFSSFSHSHYCMDWCKGRLTQNFSFCLPRNHIRVSQRFRLKATSVNHGRLPISMGYKQTAPRLLGPILNW